MLLTVITVRRMTSISCICAFSIFISIFILILPTCGAEKPLKINQIDINHNVACNVVITDGVEYLVTCTDNSPNPNENKIKCCAITESLRGLTYEWGTCHLRDNYLKDNINVISISEPTTEMCQLKLSLLSLDVKGKINYLVHFLKFIDRGSSAYAVFLNFGKTTV